MTSPPGGPYAVGVSPPRREDLRTIRADHDRPVVSLTHRARLKQARERNRRYLQALLEPGQDLDAAVRLAALPVTAEDSMVCPAGWGWRRQLAEELRTLATAGDTEAGPAT